MPEEVAQQVQDTGEPAQEAPGEPKDPMQQIDELIQEEDEVTTDAEESEEIAETETEDESAETEEAPLESPFAGKSLEEIAEDPEVQKLIRDKEAKLNESYRQKEQAAQARAKREAEERSYLENRQRAEQMNVAGIYHRLQQMVSEVTDGDGNLNLQAVQQLAEQVGGASNQQYFDWNIGLMGQWMQQVSPNYRPPQELTENMLAAQRTYSLPNAVDAFAKVVWDMSAQHVRSQLETEAQKAESDQEKVAERKAVSEKRKSSTRPSSLKGGTPADGDPRDIFLSDKASAEQKLRAFREQYGIDLPV